MKKENSSVFSASSILLLIFISGSCALIYQVCWFREFRLVFGASTAANSAVVAIFMCGLGLGGFYFGRIVDRSSRPFFIYALLEICISVIALLTPFLVILVRKIYFSTGGVAAIGPIIATTLLLLLTVLVLGIPTFMMGGTLPALASATESSLDRGRRTIGLLYGVNTLGGFLGVCIATFYLLESFGNRQTLWLAATVNLLAGLAALFLYFKFKRPVFDLNVVGTENPEAFSRGNRQDEESKCRPLFVYFAAFIVGFCFFLMELVWYRILAPILGGTTYTFGLILASALAGIGIGGWLYRQGATGRRATLWTFVFTCVLEAFFIALPFALGDRLAIFTAILGSVSAFSFVGRVMGWSLICAVVVFPAAVVAGFQFPLLIGLLGQGRDNVGKHTGLVYICNTAGAILGSLAGGFGFIPLFSVLGCWRGVVFLLLGLGLFALLQNVPKRTMEIVKACMVAILICLTGMMILAQGPTAAWRHSFIGGGLRDLIKLDKNETYDWLLDYRRRLVWEKDGVESGIAITAFDGLALIINGKSDGNARDDAGTQVMAPMIGAILHPNPQKALVIGLGTGSSAGWLGQIDSVERVDVVELEPAVLEVVRRSAPVNHNVLNNDKVKVTIGDGREVLLTTKEKYDLIFSEPSNPYRAGISSLFTREFYEAAAARMTEYGIFTQWVQAYQIDAQTIKIIYATLASVFPHVEIWVTQAADLAFVCSSSQFSYNVPSLRQKVNSEPFRSALQVAWGVSGLEGFLGGFVATSEAGKALAAEEINQKRINTDDRMLTEFGFARTLGVDRLFSINILRSEVRERGLHRPELSGGEVDWSQVDGNYVTMIPGWMGDSISEAPGLSNEESARHQIYTLFTGGNFPAILRAYTNGAWQAVYPFDMLVLGEAMADSGNEGALSKAAIVRQYWPGMSYAITARYYWRKNNKEAAISEIERAFAQFRIDPWQSRAVMIHTMMLALEMANRDPKLAPQLEEMLREPFSVLILEEYRIFSLLQVAAIIDYQHGAKVLELWEPHVPWKEKILRYRKDSYEETDHPLAQKAARDLQVFLKNSRQQSLFP